MGGDEIAGRAPSREARFASAFPQYFALVMASGIIAIAAHQLDHPAIGCALFAATAVAFVLLWLAGVVRLRRERTAVLRETMDHRAGPQFLTVVAGTAISGSMLASFHVAGWALPGLFGVAVLLWFSFVYAFLAGVTEGRNKPPLETGISGAWLLVSVATASLAVLGSDLMQQYGVQPPALAFFCYAWVLLALLYYVMMGAVVLYRFTFIPMPPDEIAGPWWINAGAAATTLLGGTKLMALGGLRIGHYTAHALLSPMMILLWIDATFWVPLLLVLFGWKHVIRHRKLRYAPGLWSVIFPLGTYSAATLQCTIVYGLGFLRPVAIGFFWAAFVAWVLAFAGMIVAMAAP